MGSGRSRARNRARVDGHVTGRAAETGRSQSELIREGIRRVTARRRRRFRSLGAGEGTGEPVGRQAEELLAATLRPRP